MKRQFKLVLSLALAVAYVTANPLEREKKSPLGVWSKEGCLLPVKDPENKGRAIWGVLDLWTDNEYELCNSPCGCYNGPYPGPQQSQRFPPIAYPITSTIPSGSLAIHLPNEYGGYEGTRPGSPAPYHPGTLVAATGYEKGSSQSQNSQLNYNAETNKANSKYVKGQGGVALGYKQPVAGSNYEKGSQNSESSKVNINANSNSANSQHEKGTSGLAYPDLTPGGYVAGSGYEKGSSNSQSSSLNVNAEHNKNNSQYSKGSQAITDQAGYIPHPASNVAGSKFEQGSHNAESSKVGIHANSNSANSQYEKGTSGLTVKPNSYPGYTAGSGYEKGNSNSQSSSLNVNAEHSKNNSQYSKGSQAITDQAGYIPHPASNVAGPKFEQGSHNAESSKVGIHANSNSANSQYEKGTLGFAVKPGYVVSAPHQVVAGSNFEKESSNSQSSSVDVSLENKKENSQFSKGSELVSTHPIYTGHPNGFAAIGSSFELGSQSAEGVHTSSNSADSQFEKGVSGVASSNPGVLTAGTGFEKGSSSSQSTSVDVNLENKKESSQFSKGSEILGSSNLGVVGIHNPGFVAGSSGSKISESSNKKVSSQNTQQGSEFSNMSNGIALNAGPAADAFAGTTSQKGSTFK